MSIGSFFLTHVAGLPRTTHRARVRRTVRLAMPDGIELVTRVFSPRGTGAHPTILMRLPYGFLGFSAVAMSYAERGFNCVLQACRGTDKSGGEFDPLVHERADGLATLDWIKAQS